MPRPISPPHYLSPIGALGWNKYVDIDMDGTANEGKGTLEKNEKRYIALNNVANTLSIFLSPIIGLIRIIVNAVFLAKGDANGEAWSHSEAAFLKAQIARGAFELIGGGYLLWIVDIFVSIGRAVERD